MRKQMKNFVCPLGSIAMSALLLFPVQLSAQEEKPLNFVMIWGDDIGYWNLSAYNQGMKRRTSTASPKTVCSLPTPTESSPAQPGVRPS